MRKLSILCSGLLLSLLLGLQAFADAAPIPPVEKTATGALVLVLAAAVIAVAAVLLIRAIGKRRK